MARVGERYQRFRLHALSALFLGVGLTLAYRLADLQVLQYDRFATLARDEHLQTKQIPARRGALLDTNGSPLAITAMYQTIDLVGAEIGDPQQLAAALAPLVEMRAEDI